MLASITVTVVASVATGRVAAYGDTAPVCVFFAIFFVLRRAPAAVSLMGGMAPKVSAKAATTAAPVGVVSSRAGPLA